MLAPKQDGRWSLLRDLLEDSCGKTTREAISLQIHATELKQCLAADPLLLEDGNILLLELHTLGTQVVNELLRL